MNNIRCPNPKNFQRALGGFPAYCEDCDLEKECDYKEYVELKRKKQE